MSDTQGADAIPRHKVPHTAIVLVPPLDIWEPIQGIRRLHDPRVGRWMPHVTLLYPFVPMAALQAAADLLRPACASFLPFALRLAQFGHFTHGGQWATLWLRPDPLGPVTRLHTALLERFAWCDDTSRHPGGFAPHLSVGRWPAAQAPEAQKLLQASWTPLRWRVDRICLIARPEEGDAPFSIHFELPLGAGT